MKLSIIKSLSPRPFENVTSFRKVQVLDHKTKETDESKSCGCINNKLYLTLFLRKIQHQSAERHGIGKNNIAVTIFTIVHKFY